jgi:hypothetical protein
MSQQASSALHIAIPCEVIPDLITTLAMFVFQDVFYSTLAQKTYSLSPYIDLSLGAVEGYNARIGMAIALLDDIPSLKPYVKSPGSVVSDDFDDTQDAAVSAQPETLPRYDPAAGTNGASSRPSNLSTSPVKQPFSSPSGLPATKKAPPPPAPKPMTFENPWAQEAPKILAVALHDFDAQEAGDLGFRAGETIEILEKSDNVNSWWKGRSQKTNQSGSFPGNYVRISN